MVRDLDLALPHVVDGRRLEMVVDGPPLFGMGAQSGCGHHSRVRIVQRREAQEKSGRCGWGCFGGSPPEERDDVPRTGWSGRSCTLGGHWRGGGRTLYFRSKAILDSIGEGKGS